MAVTGHPCVACKKSKGWCSHTPARGRYGARRRPAVKLQSRSWKGNALEGTDKDEDGPGTDLDIATRCTASPERPKIASQTLANGSTPDGFERSEEGPDTCVSKPQSLLLLISSRTQNNGAVPELGASEQSRDGTY